MNVLLTTTKILWNSVLSTNSARYCTADVKNFYLETPMERYEYMRISARLVPDEFKDAYNLHDKIVDGYIYMEIRKGMYGLPQAGIIANQLLRKRLQPHGYYECKHTPGLWRHETKPVTFSRVLTSQPGAAEAAPQSAVSLSERSRQDTSDK